jgi:hypothetical protein
MPCRHGDFAASALAGLVQAGSANRDVASVSRVDLRRDRRFTGRSNEIQLSRVGKIGCRLVAAWHSVHDFAYALQA